MQCRKAGRGKIVDSEGIFICTTGEENFPGPAVIIITFT
jgi:hypothetical protein